MPYYSLIASGRSDLDVSEIVLSRDADGEVEHRVAVGEVTEIPEELVADARSVAAQIGCRLLEMDAPKDEEDGSGSETSEQPTGVDVVAESPPVSAGEAESATAPQQGQQPNPDAATFTAPSNT